MHSLPPLALAAPTRLQGAGLVELLFSLMLLALALLGAAGALLRAERTAHQARMQSTATQLLADIAEQRLAAADAATAMRVTLLWQLRVRRELPRGQGEVEPSDAHPDSQTARVEWRDTFAGVTSRSQVVIPRGAPPP